MCEVAVREGDDGGHARTRSRVSECECHGEVCERRGTFVRESATKTATDGQRPSSGRSYFEHHAGFARQRARGSSRAAHEAAMCAAAQVKPGPETPAVDVAYPADGQKLGWDRRIWTGWVLHASVFVKLRRAEHMCSRGEPLEVRGLF